MKKSVVFVLAIFAVVVILAGCNKKKQESSMESLNGVASENVVSVGENGSDPNGAIPMIVENAETVPTSGTGETAMPATGEKPSPKQIQQALKSAGFYTGKVDGEIGPRTKKAIEAFQSQNGLKADGKVGAKTWKVLSTHLNSSSEVDNPSAVEQAPVQR